MRLQLKWTVVLFFMALQFSFAQKKTITGTVKDDTGLQLPGVTVLVKGTTNGTQTDFDGNYSISVEEGQVLKFSYVGMKTIEKKVGNRSTINVVLQVDAQVLGDVVVVGYGVTDKKDLTGSVSTVSSDMINSEPVLSVGQALQGKTSGLQVISTGGRAGDNTQISLRGNGSLRASNDVLYIIDGVPQDDMKNISPADISSITVLKDAASAAIYGSRASNGVILIETKKGSYDQPTKVSVNTNFGFQSLIVRPNLLNAKQYKQVLDASRMNYQEDIKNGILESPKDLGILKSLPDSKYDTDWLSLVLRDNPTTQNYQISVMSGGKTTKAYLSGNLFKQEGVIKDDSYTSARLKMNVEQKINDFIRIGLNSHFTYSISTPFADDNNSYQPYSKALEARPDVHPWDKNGKIKKYNFVNPLFAFQRQITDAWQNTGGNVYLDVDLYKGLLWHSSFSGNIRNRRYNYYDAPNTRRGENGEGVPTGYGHYETNNNRDYQIENTLNYNNRLFNDNLKLNLLLGHSFQSWAYEDSYVEGEKFPSDDLRWLVSAGEINKGRSYIKEMALESYFTRLQVSWNDKYHLMASVRRDGSSKFTEANRWGNFPAVSVGWTVSNEEFFKLPLVSSLKLRASYGYTGNQAGISYASGQNLIGSGENYNLQPGLAAVDIYNPDLTWEKGRSTNFGVDLTLFDRVDINFDFYNKVTENLLNRINVPQESGFRTMLANVGSISNKGFEVSVNAQVIEDGDFKWSLGGNFSYNNNKVLSIGTESGEYNTGFVSIVKEGESLGSFNLYEVKGIASEKYTYKDKDGKAGKVVQPGDMIYVDQNGDGKIDDNDMKVFAGGIAPIYGGIHTRFDYKMFDLSITSQYSIGKKVFAFYKKDALNGGATGAPSYSNNMISEMLDYWTPENKSASQPRPHMAASVSAWNTLNSTRYLEDADYFRISDITLGYNLKSIKGVDFVKSMRIYAQARNLFTFTKYSTGDPETSYVDQTAENSQDRSDGSKVGAGVDLGGIPNTKSFVIGLNVSL